MNQLLPLASLAEAWGPRGGALGARVPQERLSALFALRFRIFLSGFLTLLKRGNDVAIRRLTNEKSLLH